jgi:hypothetical protein
VLVSLSTTVGLPRSRSTGIFYVTPDALVTRNGCSGQERSAAIMSHLADSPDGFVQGSPQPARAIRPAGHLRDGGPQRPRKSRPHERTPPQ